MTYQYSQADEHNIGEEVSDSRKPWRSCLKLASVGIEEKWVI